MNTENNVVSLEHSVVLHMENAIVNALSGRAGKWVASHVLFSATDTLCRPNMSTSAVIEEMVNAGTLEKSFQTVNEKFHRAVRLQLYRLALQW